MLVWYLPYEQMNRQLHNYQARISCTHANMRSPAERVDLRPILAQRQPQRGLSSIPSHVASAVWTRVSSLRLHNATTHLPLLGKAQLTGYDLGTCTTRVVSN